ncbi:protein KHNYN isoform X2 [Trachinotus anak]|uniref:protein KHNYN isoform X2 n=1 Tax=Trachinotus anak TaxID=443729 RepID=UPI0039F2069D
MDSERSDGGGGGGGGGGGEPEVEDEFACAGVLRGSLASLHGTVERIFRVTFGIGSDDLPHGNNGQIWLKLRGHSNNVKAAKLFVKGVVNQEEQQEVSYPMFLHCVFCGARGLFMDCLMKSTSAHIVVGSQGFLLISGLAEPVVRAYSLITDLVDRYEGTQSRRPENGDRGSGESLDSRRAFKILVEKWEDRHTLDLLVLPGAVKEILLDLVRESGLGSSPELAVTDRSESEDRWDQPSAITYTPPEPSNTTDRWVEGMTAGSGKDTAAKGSFQSFSASAGARGRAEGAEERLMHSPQEVGEEGQPEQRVTLGIKDKDRLEGEEEQEQQLSMGNKEFLLLLKFFTAMGYTEDVVKRVLARTGPKEASQILDLVQQEQDRSDREQMLHGGPDAKHKDGVTLNKSEGNRPCETEHREDEETPAGGDKAISSNGEVGEVREGEGHGAAGCTRHFEGGSVEEKEEGHEEDFVLGVLKKAAASCGYTEHKVAKVYNMLPDRSTHQLLLELQREGSKETDFREGPREMDDVVLERDGPKDGPPEEKEKRESDDEGWVKVPDLTVPVAEPNLSSWIDKPQQPPMSKYTSQPKRHRPSKSQTPHQILPEVKGPPMPTYSTSLDPPLTNFQTDKHHDQIYWPNPSTSKQSHSTYVNVLNPKPPSSSSVKQALQASQPPIFHRNDSSPTRGRERRGFVPSSSVVVTGEQRFLEGLQTPFQLKLTDKPGDPTLRTIIIDGSNVAMSHGLGHFFSCRGIALAVQHFWDRGHRRIITFLPQWRQKSDPKIKEQHYLTELQTLGLLSYTPSREVQGKRISSYDDRFMLQHAQKTDGVIVTNDNLRDLSDESPVWRDIIKKRLLQYTFVGDHFMVPDDPLGRGGPHLDNFLRTPDPGNHSYAGVATNFPSSKPPRSQTEVLNFRDRTLGGGPDQAGRGGRGKGRGHGKGWDVGHQHRQQGAAGPGQVFRAERNPEETARLREQLCQVFPGQDNMVTLVLQCHATVTDINMLSDLILEQQKD